MVQRGALIAILGAIGCNEPGLGVTDGRAPDELGPVLEFSPEAFTFSQSCVDDTVDIALINQGDEPLSIDRIRFDAESTMLRLSQSDPTPFEVPVGESALVTVSYLPTRPLEVHGSLSVRSDDPRGERSAAVIALADDIARTQTFDPHDPPVDVLIAIDTTGSMTTLHDQGTITEGLQGLVDELELATGDWKVGLLWGIDDCITGVVRSDATKDPVADIAAGFPTVAAPENDAMFAMVDAALQQTRSQGCNRQFIRDGAHLAVVLLGNSIPEDRPWHDVVSNWASYKDDCRDLTVHAIVNATFTDSPYLAGAEATGGAVVNSLGKSTWNHKWSQVGAAMGDRAVLMPLGHTPDASSVEVTVGGETWTTGWSLDPLLDGIRVVRFVPAGESVQIDYDIAECLPRECYL